MLERRPGGHFGFVHRVFGEFLAAEALLERPDQIATLFDVAAPIVTQRVRGLRYDWAVPITLLAVRDARWRAELAERDGLAAARAVPPSAPASERLEAGRLIW